MGLTNNTGKLSNTLTSNGTQITLGGSTVTDGNLLNIIGNQSSVNVGVVFNNTNGTYPKIYGLTNVNNNFVLYDYSSSATRLTISTTGAATFSSNVGIGGVTLASWYTGYAAMQIGASASIFGNKTTSDTNTTQLANNSYLNTGATAWQYINTDEATRYEQVNGEHNFYSVASGSAGANITWGTPKLTIASTGNVGIGTSSPATRFDLAGTIGNFQIAASGAEVFLTRNDNNDILATGGTSSGITIGAQSYVRFSVGTSYTERMRITSGGKVGINGYDTGVQLYVKSTTTGSSDYPLYLANSSVGIFYVRSDGYISTGTASGSPYNNTSGAAANMVVNSGGGIERSTSSLKYKKEIRDYDKGLAEVMAMRPVYYKGKNPNDGDKQFAGLIAEEIDALGLNEFVTYAEDGSPDALAYQNMIALLTKAIQELNAKVTALENK